MPTSVFPLRCSYPLRHGMKQHIIIQDMGDGHEQRISKSQNYGPRADGQGNQLTYKGVNYFGINLRNLEHVNATATKTANILWDFYLDMEGPLTAFYFYNPAENTGDPNSSPLNLGIDTVGRYLVRFQNAFLERELFRRFLYNSTIDLIEVRE